MSNNTLPSLTAKVKLYQDKSDKPTKLLAFAELTIAGHFVIKNLRVMTKTESDADEPFVFFPSQKGTGANADKYFDIANPITAEARKAASKAVLDAYVEAVAKEGE